MAQHKWHKEIKAWADGAEIEYRTFDEDTNNWTEWQHWSSPNDTSIAFIKEKGFEYRIKPQPIQTFKAPTEPTHVKKPQYLYVYLDDNYELSTIPLDNDKWKYIGKIKLETDDD